MHLNKYIHFSSSFTSYLSSTNSSFIFNYLFVDLDSTSIKTLKYSKYELLQTDIKLDNQEGTTSGVVSFKSMMVKSFKVSEGDIEPSSDWRQAFDISDLE